MPNKRSARAKPRESVRVTSPLAIHARFWTETASLGDWLLTSARKLSRPDYEMSSAPATPAKKQEQIYIPSALLFTLSARILKPAARTSSLVQTRVPCQHDWHRAGRLSIDMASFAMLCSAEA